MLFTIVLRLPFLDAPLSSDEGGYAEIARLWSGGHALYTGVWVDRPQGLILAFRGVLGLGLTTTVGLRIAAAAVGAALVLATIAVATRAGGKLPGVAAGALAATAGASPFIEGFTLAGESLAAVVAALSVYCLLRSGADLDRRWLALAGLLAGSAMMIKQSAFDAAVAAAIVILARSPRQALRPLAVLAGAWALPVAAAVLLSGDVGAWWQAVVGYGLRASVTGHSAWARIGHFGDSAPAAAMALAPVAVAAALGARRAPFALRVWLAAALVGVLVGGNFHAHYYLQLVAPLACVGAFAVERFAERRVAVAVLAGACAVCIFPAARLWTAGDEAQARAVWPRDPHLQSDTSVAAYLSRHAPAGHPIYVLWAAADLYYLADRPPAYRYLWLRNIQTTRGAVESVRSMLLRRPPSHVVVVEPPGIVDRSGATAAILRRHYRVVARFGSTWVYRPRGAA